MPPEKRAFTIILEREEDGGYSVVCPALPGCVSQGDDRREALRIVRETELAKTQALIEQLEREKIILGIWQEIVDEKLAGAKARADITNTYLMEIEANAAEFKASVVAKAAEVRRLQEINDAIIAHNDDIERQLAAQEEREAEQRKKLEDLHIETPELPQRLATPQLQPRNHSPLAVGLLESNKWGNR